MHYYAWDARTGTIRQGLTNPRSAAFEENLFSLEGVPDKHRQVIEREYLSHVDDAGAVAFHKLLDKGVTALTAEERADWTRLLMSFRLRTPELVTYLKQSSQEELERQLKLQPQDYEVIRQPGDPETLLQAAHLEMPVEVANFGMLMFHELINDKEWGEKIYKMHWWIESLTDTVSIVTSDRPCVILPGLDYPNATIALPITPSRVFLAAHSRDIEARIHRELSRAQLAMRINANTARAAIKYVYSATSINERFLAKTLGKQKAC